MIYLFPLSVPPEDDDTKEFASVTLNDIQRIETLGMGGFGRVELVS